MSELINNDIHLIEMRVISEKLFQISCLEGWFDESKFKSTDDINEVTCNSCLKIMESEQ